LPRLTVLGHAPVDIDRAHTLLSACEAHGIPMGSSCGGFACCNACRVDVLEGVLTPCLPEEHPFLDGPRQRLGCQARLVGDAVVALAPGC
jgi:ferredoxin